MPEQSMDEILASIRQIISEDVASVAAAEGHGGPAGGPSAGRDDDVLVLRERAPPEPSPFAPPSDAAAHAEPAAEGRPPAEPAGAELASGNPGEEVGEGRSLALTPSAETAVVAHETAAVVAASFERLAFVVENTPPPPPFHIAPGAATLEDITREILAPVIKAWLDENLPALVRARVDEEVERITRGRVR